MIIKILRNGKSDVYISGATKGLKANLREGSSSMTSKPAVEMTGVLKRHHYYYLKWFHQVLMS